jgi:cation transporter-like permease
MGLILLVLILTVALLGFCGFVAGLRPSRHDPPTRLVAVLILYSVPVALAIYIPFSDQWFARLRLAFDPKGLAIAAVLSLVDIVGVVALVPAWGYALGRTLTYARLRTGARLAKSRGSPPL